MDCLFNGELEDCILELKNANHFLGSERPCKKASPRHRVEQRLALQPDQSFPYRRLADLQAIGQLADDELLAWSETTVDCHFSKPLVGTSSTRFVWTDEHVRSFRTRHTP
jgi:hypothetical protein